MSEELLAELQGELDNIRTQYREAVELIQEKDEKLEKCIKFLNELSNAHESKFRASASTGNIHAGWKVNARELLKDING